MKPSTDPRVMVIIFIEVEIIYQYKFLLWYRYVNVQDNI